MTSPARAIAWEIWQKNRLGNLLCLACIAAFTIQAMAWAKWRPPTRSEPALSGDAVVLVIFPMLATIIWAFNIFAHTERDAHKGFSGVPARMFTLPVRTPFLVACMMLYGVAAIAALYLAWAELVFRPFGLGLPLGWPLLVAAAGICSFQAAVWGLSSFPWIRIWVIAFGAIALIAVSAFGFGEPSTGWLNSRNVTWLLLAWLPLMYAAAVFGVNAERHGGWHAWARMQPLFRRIADALPRWRGPFASAAQAQFWFEWRRKGWFLTAAIALSIAGGVLLFPVAILLEERPSLPVLAFLSMLFLPLLAGASGGAELAKSDFWSGEAAIRPFHATRPLTDAGLVLAKLKVASVVILLGWLLAGVLSGVLMSWSRWLALFSIRLGDQPSPLSAISGGGGWTLVTTLAATIMITWHSMITSLSIGLIGRRKAITTYSLIGAGVLFGAVAGVSWFYLHPTNRPLLLWLFYLGTGAFALWKIRSMIRSIAEVRRRGLLGSSGIRLACFLWILFVVCLLAWFGTLWWLPPVPRAMLLFGLVWFWPGGELLQCLLHLAANRHR